VKAPWGAFTSSYEVRLGSCRIVVAAHAAVATGAAAFLAATAFLSTAAAARAAA
jgi:hypothetical protein